MGEILPQDKAVVRGDGPRAAMIRPRGRAENARARRVRAKLYNVPRSNDEGNGTSTVARLPTRHAASEYEALTAGADSAE